MDSVICNNNEIKIMPKFIPHWSLVFWFPLLISNPVTLISIYLFLILHELGHWYTGKYLGYKTGPIHLNMMGGAAIVEFTPEKPKDEFIIAIMGPAVNAWLYIFFSLTNANTLANVNFILMAFNLGMFFLPCDGGRIIRSLNAIICQDYIVATKRMVYVGLISLIIFFLYAFSTFNMFNAVVYSMLLSLFYFSGLGEISSIQNNIDLYHETVKQLAKQDKIDEAFNYVQTCPTSVQLDLVDTFKKNCTFLPYSTNYNKIL